MVDVKVRAVRAAMNTSIGTQDFTVSGFGTPKAALFLFAHATSSDTSTSHCRFGIGATDGTNQRALSLRAEDGQGTSDTSRARSNADVIYVASVTTGTTIDVEANWDSWVTDGVRINITNAPGSAFLLTVVLFGGSDLSAYVNEYVGNATQDATTTVTGVGFEPDQIIGFSAQANFTPATNTHGRCWLGFADNGAGQGGWAIDKRNGNAAGQQTGAGSDTVFIRRHTAGSTGAGTVGAGHEVTSYNSDGFVVTTRDASQGFTTGFLALNYGGGSHWMGRVDAPTSASIQNNEGPGFEPQVVFAIPSSTNDALDTAVDSDEAGAQGMCVFTGTEEFAVMVTGDDGPATTDEESYHGAAAVYSDNLGAAENLEASLDSFDSLGFNLDFTTVQSIACKIWYMAIEAGTVQVDVNETVNITEDVELQRALVLIQGDTVHLTEAIALRKATSLVVNETVHITENVQLLKGLQLILNETVEISEATDLARAMSLIVGETVNILEAVQTRRAATLTVNETVQITEAVQLARAILVVVNETENIQEATIVLPGSLITVNETVNITEAILALTTVEQQLMATPRGMVDGS